MNRNEANYHLRALAVYRNLLTAYLHEYQAWGAPDIPPKIVTGISILRQDIMEVKGLLRSHNIAVANAEIDEGPVDERPANIAHQRELLKIYRQRLASVLRQRAAAFSTNVPSHLDVELTDLRQKIAQTKAILQNWNVHTDDLPADEASL